MVAREALQDHRIGEAIEISGVTNAPSYPRQRIRIHVRCHAGNGFGATRFLKNTEKFRLACSAVPDDEHTFRLENPPMARKWKKPIQDGSI